MKKYKSLNMKKFYLVLMVLFTSVLGLKAQDGGVSIGKGDVAAYDKAVLDVFSKNKGVLIPRMTTTERLAIFDSDDFNATGLIVYDTDTNRFYYWEGDKWNAVVSSGDGSSFSINDFTYVADTLKLSTSDGDYSVYINTSILNMGPTLPATANEGETFYNETDNMLYIYNGGAWMPITAKETITTLLDNNDGTYTYTNEIGQDSIIDVVGDIALYGDTLLSNDTFLTRIVDTLLTDTSFVFGMRDTLLGDTVFMNSVSEEVLKDTSFIAGLTDTLLSDTTFISGMKDTLLMDSKFTDGLLDSILSSVENVNQMSDTLFNNQNFIDSLTRVIRDSQSVTEIVKYSEALYVYENELGEFDTIDVVGDIALYGDTLLSNDTFLTRIVDSLLTDTSFVFGMRDTLLGDTVFMNSVSEEVLKDTSFIAGLTDTLLSDTTFISGIKDTLLMDSKFTDGLLDSILSSVENVNQMSDTLFNNQNFIDSLTSVIRDSQYIASFDSIGNSVYKFESGIPGDSMKFRIVSDSAGNLIDINSDGGAYLSVDSVVTAMGYDTILTVYSAEYAGAVLDTGDVGISHLGEMTSGNTGDITTDAYDYMNYYEWATTENSLQTYQVILRAKLPSNFVKWNDASGVDPVSVSYQTEGSSPEVSIVMRNITKNSSTTAFGGASATWAEGTVTPATADADDFILFIITLTAVGDGVDFVDIARVGDITLNYIIEK